MADDVTVTIYMPLTDQPGEYRPVKAVRQREDIYCVVGPVGPGEQWKYPPGTMVRRKSRILPNGKEEMVAMEA
ncbi:MAG TPA: hypothetical protein VGD10_05640 [Allosphingosinicella sp.]|uniref:hypothetical protein n=1 Tax=Allosphingosinicella sp. TaxID=2823234 RepID=UPI002ED80653